jgi:methyl-accepting chemotaxis protein
MRWFCDLKIGDKLQSSFTLVAVITALIGWAGLAKVSWLNTNASAVYAGRLVPIENVAYANVAFFRTGDTTQSVLPSAAVPKTNAAPGKLPEAVTQSVVSTSRRAAKSGGALKNARNRRLRG